MENADPQASTHVAGNVSTGGDFVGRDQIVHGNKVKVSGVELTDVTASGDINIHDIHVGFTYTNVIPRPVDATTLKEAKAKLAKLPVKRVPSVAPLPPGSRMPHSFNPLFVGCQDDLRTLAVALKGGKTVAAGQIAAATGLGP